MTLERCKYWFALLFRVIWGLLPILLPLALALFGMLFSSKIDVTITHRMNDYSETAAACTFAMGVVLVVQFFLSNNVDKGALDKEVFLKLYSRSLDAAIKTTNPQPLTEERMEAVGSAAAEQEFRQTIEALLSLVVSIAAAFQNRDKLDLNANLMIATPLTKLSEQEFNAIEFLPPNAKRSEFIYVLRIYCWSKPGHHIKRYFGLPIAADESSLLFGAPQAFYTDQPQPINDTTVIRPGWKGMSNQHPSVQKKISRHFVRSESLLKSFVSLRVNCGNYPHAVLNIQSNKLDVYGLSKQDREELLYFLQPFISVMSIKLKESAIIWNR